MPSTPLPCAACKIQRRKCTSECILAPYFPQDETQKFESIHKIFGRSNLTKLLKEITPSQRQDAVHALHVEAEMRLLDPVYGIMSIVFLLEKQLGNLKEQIYNARRELSVYNGHDACLPVVQSSPDGMLKSGRTLQQIYTARSSYSGHLYQQQLQMECIPMDAQAVVAFRNGVEARSEESIRGMHQQDLTQFNGGGNYEASCSFEARECSSSTMSRDFANLVCGSHGGEYRLQSRMEAEDNRDPMEAEIRTPSLAAHHWQVLRCGKDKGKRILYASD